MKIIEKEMELVEAMLAAIQAKDHNNVKVELVQQVQSRTVK